MNGWSKAILFLVFSALSSVFCTYGADQSFLYRQNSKAMTGGEHASQTSYLMTLAEDLTIATYLLGDDNLEQTATSLIKAKFKSNPPERNFPWAYIDNTFLSKLKEDKAKINQTKVAEQGTDKVVSVAELREINKLIKNFDTLMTQHPRNQDQEGRKNLSEQVLIKPFRELIHQKGLSLLEESSAGTEMTAELQAEVKKFNNLVGEMLPTKISSEDDNGQDLEEITKKLTETIADFKTSQQNIENVTQRPHDPNQTEEPEEEQIVNPDKNRKEFQDTVVDPPAISSNLSEEEDREEISSQLTDLQGNATLNLLEETKDEKQGSNSNTIQAENTTQVSDNFLRSNQTYSNSKEQSISDDEAEEVENTLPNNVDPTCNSNNPTPHPGKPPKKPSWWQRKEVYYTIIAILLASGAIYWYCSNAKGVPAESKEA